MGDGHCGEAGVPLVEFQLYVIFFQLKNADYFSQYVTEDFNSYIKRKRENHCHGNHIAMQAMCEMYNRTIEVYQYSTGGFELLKDYCIRKLPQ